MHSIGRTDFNNSPACPSPIGLPIELINRNGAVFASVGTWHSGHRSVWQTRCLTWFF